MLCLLFKLITITIRFVTGINILNPQKEIECFSADVFILTTVNLKIDYIL